MIPLIDVEECLQDSPKFRKTLEIQETSLEILDRGLEKVLKQCNSMVELGKSYVASQSLFANSLWELNVCFRDDQNTLEELKKIIHTLQETNRFQTTLLDQASRTIVKNIHSFIKEDIKDVTESKHYFSKLSSDLDIALQKHSSASKTKISEIEDTTNLLTATRTAFRHTALAHLNKVTLLHTKKRQVLLSTLLSYIQACRTYYHQGFDLYDGLEPFMKELDEKMVYAKQETIKLSKKLNDRPAIVSNDDLVKRNLMKPRRNSNDTNNTIRMQGYLFKRTTNAFKSWNRRWFYLNDKQLKYRKRTGEEHATIMEEDMRLCSVRPAGDIDRRFCFEIISPNKSHMVQADSEESYKAWIQALQEAIGAAIQASKSHHHNYHDNEHTAETLDISQSKNVRPKKKMWEVLLKIPGNHLCCDCGNTDPKWASINLGITLCIECSGVHRSLGVHFSKVRSLTLDTWEPEVIKVMAELGNTIVNSVYLGNLNTNETTIIKSNCDITSRELWIKQKYIDKKYVKLLHQNNTTPPPNDKTLKLPKSVVRKWSVRKIRRRGRSIDKLKNKKLNTIIDNNDPSTSTSSITSSNKEQSNQNNSPNEDIKTNMDKYLEEEIPKTDLDLNCILSHFNKENFKLADETISSEHEIEEKNIPNTLKDFNEKIIPNEILKTEGNSLFYASHIEGNTKGTINEQIDKTINENTKFTSDFIKNEINKIDFNETIKNIPNQSDDKTIIPNLLPVIRFNSDDEKLSDCSIYTTCSSDMATSDKPSRSQFTSCNDLPNIDVTNVTNDVYVFGGDSIGTVSSNNEDDINPSLDFSSDESATESDDVAVAEEEISNLTPETLLYRASAVHNLSVMCHALALGANKNWINKSDRDRTYLHQAVISNSVMACAYLILNGSVINCRDSEGKTPLYIATELGHTAQVCLLLKHKADQHIADKYGCEPLTIAVDKANADIVTLLRLGRLNEEMKESNENGSNDETFNDVVRDFSQKYHDKELKTDNFENK